MMRGNLAVAATHEAQQAGLPVPAGHEASMKEVQSALKDLQINLLGDRLRAYALFAIYGKTISLQLEGTLEAKGERRYYPPQTDGRQDRLTPDSVLHT